MLKVIPAVINVLIHVTNVYLILKVIPAVIDVLMFFLLR